MFDKIKNIKKDELVRGGIILFLMMNIANFLNYIFQFSMARLLGPVDYGIFAVLMALLYIFLIPSETVQTILAKYTSKFNVKKKLGKISELLKRSMKNGLIFSAAAFLILIPVAFFLSGFLNISLPLIIITNLFVILAFTSPIVRGILQGMKRFRELGINIFIESFIKIVAGILLVLFSWKVYGGVAGIILGGVVSLILAYYILKKTLPKKSKEEKFKGIYSYSLPIFVVMISIVLMYSLDIILARRFFSPEIAGKYAVAAIMGKIILFATFSIGKAMFPIATEKHESGKSSLSIFRKAFTITLLISLSALLIYFFFPKLVVSLLFGQAYLEVYNILFLVGLAYTFLTLANIIILYGISANKIKNSAFFSFIPVILQIALLSIFNSNLFMFSLALVFSNIAMLIYSIIVVVKK